MCGGGGGFFKVNKDVLGSQLCETRRFGESANLDVSVSHLCVPRRLRVSSETMCF